jgi:hypothetical protein
MDWAAASFRRFATGEARDHRGQRNMQASSGVRRFTMRPGRLARATFLHPAICVMAPMRDVPRDGPSGQASHLLLFQASLSIFVAFSA